MERMREELVRRNYATTTIHSYLKAVEHFRNHVNTPIDEVGPDDLRSYHAYLLGTRKLAVNTVVLNICALRFLYIKVLKRRDMKEDLPYPKQRLRLPVILSPGEVAQLIGAARNLYHRTILMTLYSTGLRRAELCRLKVADVDSKRMMLRVVQGKGGIDREVPLSQKLLGALREYYRWMRPETYLFPGTVNHSRADKPISEKIVWQAVHEATIHAGIKKRVTPHTLRHYAASRTMPRVGASAAIHGHLNCVDAAWFWRAAWHSGRVINQLFTFSSTIERLRQGPLSEHLDAYAAAVGEQGYAPDSIKQQIVVIADFSRWLKKKQIAVQALDSKAVDRFLRLRRRQQRVRRGDPKTLQRLLTMLRQIGVVKHQPPVVDTAHSRIVAEFQRYLLQERGLSPLTLLNYVPVVEQFLAERFHNRAPNFAMLRAPHVTGFVMRHAHQLSPKRAGLMVTALRSFFRYLRHRGAIATDLAGCVPTVPNWSLSTLPRFLPAATVERILECCDRKTSVGRRNHAILLLLARLGVRAGEVVGLSLDDIDWNTGQITIRGKGGKSAQLPLATDVGAALAAYLRHDRPRSATRRVFLRHRAPLVGFGNSSTISSLVRRALKHAGVESAHTGAHVLRHSLATSLLRQGGSLDEIGELLRHQSPNTTAIYAKVDVTALHTLALPWPGGGR